MKTQDIDNGKAVDTIDWYDGPLSLTTKNDAGEMFYWHMIDIWDGSYVYVAVEVSAEQKRQLLDSKLSYLDLLLHPTREVFYVIKNEEVAQYNRDELLKEYPKEFHFPKQEIFYMKKKTSL